MNEEQSSERPYKVLIVDDDKFLLNMYVIKFKKENFEVTAASDGKSALDILRGGLEPDAMILDIIMPVMDGLEVLENMRKEGLAKKTAVMVLSNQGQSNEIEQAKKFNIDSYIVKATTIPAEVVTEVRQMIKRVQAQNR